MTTRKKQWILTIVSASPLLWLALAYGYIIRARIYFGHWPSAADGMAKYLKFASFHHDLTVDMVLISPAILVGVVVFAFLFRRYDSSFRVWIPLSALVGSIFLCLVFWAIDPGGFLLWLAD
jgi:hypothetical protein